MQTDEPKPMTNLERRVYASIQARSRFVGLSIDDLCRRAGIAPSTFSRWINGHNSGLIITIGKMDEILTHLEAEKFHSYEQRMRGLGIDLVGLCLQLELSALDYVRWVRRELDPDYAKLATVEQFLTKLENHKQQQEERHAAKNT
jgi:transcriptional regulator with XRE-family HTH domain